MARTSVFDETTDPAGWFDEVSASSILWFDEDVDVGIPTATVVSRGPLAFLSHNKPSVNNATHILANLLITTLSLTPPPAQTPFVPNQFDSVVVNRQVIDFASSVNTKLLSSRPYKQQETFTPQRKQVSFDSQIVNTKLLSPRPAIQSDVFVVQRKTITFEGQQTNNLLLSPTTTVPFIPLQQTFVQRVKEAYQFNQYNLTNGLFVIPSVYIISPTGGITFSGVITEIRERIISPIGDITFSGIATRENTNIIEPSGTLTFNGTATMVFVPAGVVIETSRLPMTGAGVT